MGSSVYFDTNIIIDLFDGQRVSHRYSKQVLQKYLLDEKSKLWINSDTMTNLFYILRNRVKLDLDEALEKLEFVKEVFGIVAVDAIAIERAIVVCKTKLFDDYEDALQYICAESQECTLIITNNQKDFKNSMIDVLSSKELVEQWD